MESNRLKEGKLPWNILSKLLSLLPTSDPDLVVGPSIGEDAAVLKFNNGFLVLHSDPITTAVKRIGWYAIHIAANDVAVRGAKPRWFLATVMLPPKISLSEVEEIFKDMGVATRELDGVIIGGHTEVTPGLDRPLINITAIGFSPDRVIFTRNARPGDSILVIGRIGGEGVSIIAHDYEEYLIKKGVAREVIDKAKKFIEEISVVDKALLLKEYNVNSMHDPTEGGVLQAIHEIALASKTEIHIYAERIAIDPVVKTITDALNVDPLKLLSSGTIVATIPSDRINDLTCILDDKGIEYSVIGEVVKPSNEPGKVYLHSRSGVEIIDSDIIDEIYRVITTIN